MTLFLWCVGGYLGIGLVTAAWAAYRNNQWDDPWITTTLWWVVWLMIAYDRLPQLLGCVSPFEYLRRLGASREARQ